MNISVKEILNDELAVLGFRKRGVFWYRRTEEVICVVGLQKSQWGDQYYINLAIWVNLFGEMKYPRVQDCHIQCRLESVTPEKADDLARALDEEDGWKMDFEQRRDILKLGVSSADFLFFRELSTFKKIKTFVSERPRFNCAIAKILTDKKS